MKASGLFAAILLAGACLAPVYAGPMLDKAVALAAHDSGASMSEIYLAAYEAAKESPENLDVVLSQMLGQRTNWTPAEVCALANSILLARPDLASQASAYSAAYADMYNGNAPAQGTGEGVSAAVADSVMYKFFAALHEASLGVGVAQTVVNALAGHVSHLNSLNNSQISSPTAGAMEHAPYVNPDPEPEVEPEVTPTPDSGSRAY